MIDKNLALFQLCDANFPIGSFSHSFGLEYYIQEEIVYDKDSFIIWLETYLFEQLIYSDGLAVRLVYEALAENNFTKILTFDHRLIVQTFAKETRVGIKQMGERMVKMALTLYDEDILKLYYEKIKNNEAFGHPALGFTMVGHSLGVEKNTTVLYYLYSIIASLIQNGVRAIPLGQTTGQVINHLFQRKLMDAVNEINELHEEDFGIISPGLELAQMQHERLNIRIFMS